MTNETLTDCGCATCDHMIADTFAEVVECENSLLRDMDDVEHYLGVADETTLAIPKDDLYDLYRTLAKATEAAAAGNPNECASLAADAKQQVLALHEEATDD